MVIVQIVEESGVFLHETENLSVAHAHFFGFIDTMGDSLLHLLIYECMMPHENTIANRM